MMRLLARLRRLAPYVGALAVILLTAGLVATIWLTALDLQWLAFLGGVLMAASVALASRFSTNAWTLARRTSQLAVARSKLATEGVLRKRAEASLSGIHRTEHYVEELLPAMLSYIDPARRVQYHNRSYAEWLGKPNSRLEGQELAALLGADAWPEVAARLDDAFAGAVVRYERVQAMPDGQPCRIAATYLPHFGSAGNVEGVFCVLTDITARADRRGAIFDAAAGTRLSAQYSSTLAGELTSWSDVGDRLKGALRNNEFALFAQRIEPALANPDAPPFHEVLVRLQEEEDNLMPPGAFLPLAEEHGLLPELDRWVVARLLDWADEAPGREQETFSVNVSQASITDAGFVSFVRDRQGARGGRGPTLCFEFTEAEVQADLDGAIDFARQLKRVGCRFALSGFGRPPVSFEVPRAIAFDYIKIDAGVVLATERSPVELAKVKAITRVAHSLGAKTIAECVESESVRTLLREAGVDFVQGFGVARPAPLGG